MHKNLIAQSYMMRRNNVLKSLALFFLGASAVLLFTSADLVLNPYISNSFVYLQKLFLSPTGTSNSTASISFDGLSGSIVANSFSGTNISVNNLNASVFTSAVASVTDKIKANQICDTAGNSCFNAATVSTASGDLATLSARVQQLTTQLTQLSGAVSAHLAQTPTP